MACNEIFQNATSNLTKIDISPPNFSSGPYLNVTSNGNLEASWSASDSHSGLLGYLYALDTCDFSNSSVSYSSTVTFINPGEGSHFLCVRAVDFVGNVRTLTSGSSILDTVPPSLTVNNFPTDWINSSSTHITWTSADINGVLEVTIDSDIGGQISGLPSNGSFTFTLSPTLIFTSIISVDSASPKFGIFNAIVFILAMAPLCLSLFFYL